jgi:hypothetical protein
MFNTSRLANPDKFVKCFKNRYLKPTNPRDNSTFEYKNDGGETVDLYPFSPIHKRGLHFNRAKDMMNYCSNGSSYKFIADIEIPAGAPVGYGTSRLTRNRFCWSNRVIVKNFRLLVVDDELFACDRRWRDVNYLKALMLEGLLTTSLPFHLQIVFDLADKKVKTAEELDALSPRDRETYLLTICTTDIPFPYTQKSIDYFSDSVQSALRYRIRRDMPDDALLLQSYRQQNDEFNALDHSRPELKLPKPDSDVAVEKFVSSYVVGLSRHVPLLARLLDLGGRVFGSTVRFLTERYYTFSTYTENMVALIKHVSDHDIDVMLPFVSERGFVPTPNDDRLKPFLRLVTGSLAGEAQVSTEAVVPMTEDAGDLIASLRKVSNRSMRGTNIVFQFSAPREKYVSEAQVRELVVADGGPCITVSHDDSYDDDVELACWTRGFRSDRFGQTGINIKLDVHLRTTIPDSDFTANAGWATRTMAFVPYCSDIATRTLVPMNFLSKTLFRAYKLPEYQPRIQDLPVYHWVFFKDSPTRYEEYSGRRFKIGFSTNQPTDGVIKTITVYHGDYRYVRATFRLLAWFHYHTPIDGVLIESKFAAVCQANEKHLESFRQLKREFNQMIGYVRRQLDIETDIIRHKHIIFVKP